VVCELWSKLFHCNDRSTRVLSQEFFFFVKTFIPWDAQSKAHPVFSIKINFSKIRLRTGWSNWINFVQTVAVFVMGYGCARRSARE